MPGQDELDQLKNLTKLCAHLVTDLGRVNLPPASKGELPKYAPGDVSYEDYETGVMLHVTKAPDLAEAVRKAAAFIEAESSNMDELLDLAISDQPEGWFVRVYYIPERERDMDEAFPPEDVELGDSGWPKV